MSVLTGLSDNHLHEHIGILQDDIKKGNQAISDNNILRCDYQTLMDNKVRLGKAIAERQHRLNQKLKEVL